jgi:PAS domain S-box-containing protein
MKLEDHDLEKIELILHDALFASEAPLVFLAVKKENTPQFAIRIVLPQAFPAAKEHLFLPSVNPFVNSVHESQSSAFSKDVQEAIKNLMTVYDVETAARPAPVKCLGLAPIIIEKDVAGLLFFGAREPNPRIMAVINSFARQISYFLSIREYQRIAREANQKSEQMMAASSDAFFTIDTQSGRIHVSQNLQELTGHAPEEFLRGLIESEKYVFQEDLQKVKDFFRDTFAGKRVGVEFRMQRKDGNLIWFSILSNPIFDSTGKLVAIQGVGRDVSENKKATWELEKTKEREQMKTEFMSVISHELRTPLTPIQGYTDMLLSGQAGPLSPGQKDALTTIRKQSRRLLNLIDSVLDITRVEYGKPIEIRKEPVSLNAIIEEVVGGISFQFQEKDIKLECDLSPEIETILADEAKITRVVSNLLGNTLKFTPKKGKVGIRSKKVGADVQIEVSDSGVGIDPDHLEKIFEKFYQVDSSYTRQEGGIGMGLAIVREIVEAHGGKVWAESEGLGRGSKFIFTLPLA